MMLMEGNPLGLSTNLEVVQTLGRDMWGHHWNSTPNDWNMAVSCKVSKSNTLLETQWLEVPCSTVGSGGYQPRWGDWCDFFSSAYRDLLLFLMNKAMRLLVRGRTPHQTNLILWNTRSENRNVIMIIMVWYGTKTLFLRTCVPSQHKNIATALVQISTATNSTESLSAVHWKIWKQALRSAACHVTVSNCSTTAVLQVNLQNTGSFLDTEVREVQWWD